MQVVLHQRKRCRTYASATTFLSMHRLLVTSIVPDLGWPGKVESDRRVIRCLASTFLKAEEVRCVQLRCQQVIIMELSLWKIWTPLLVAIFP
ncbi:unnamed protein product, partial [Cylicostephanus goldi]